ncbi:phosphatidylinositol 4-phosphate 5-kinase-like isoform X1 [Microplitis mediator]|uniref:phosphatidylinositol 4-phosphate 5-kinase-like isoform X1 n=1 Tax=Microplitis mediator TaxID=375433 RepID=UPI002554B702|nr:phosphatidylinositol 4-phosphate 5-kinase-like isoform X1 [Microplitis mediator]XP_057337944.1 phosphatidylinositol 4-phosphate 5-kinase-like isoform X1 [Microplitis mediator]
MDNKHCDKNSVIDCENILKEMNIYDNKINKNSIKQEDIDTDDMTVHISKKKLKKERQRAKKLEAAKKPSNSSGNQKNSQVSNSKKNINNDVDEKIDDIGNDNNSSNSNLDNDIDELSLEHSAFVQSIVKQKNKFKNNSIVKNNKNSIDNIADSNNVNSIDSSDDLQGFTVVKKDKNNRDINCNKTPEGYGKEGFRLIMKGQKADAIYYFTKAIKLNKLDIRHYINRSYCYLNVGSYIEALSDIKFVISRTDDPVLISIMKCRQAQALMGLEHYNEAETCFQEALNVLPDCLPVKFELYRMKIIQLINMGFSERYILEIFRETPLIKMKDAIAILCELNSDYDKQFYDNNINNDIESEIFQSDSEDNPSNTSIFMEIFDYNDHSNSWQASINIEEESASTKMKAAKNTKKAESKVIGSKGKATEVTDAVKTPQKNTTLDAKAVWVGSLNPKIKDSMLHKKFSEFGKINSVAVVPGERYGFINFVEARSAQRAVEAGSVELCGINLPIKMRA